MDRWNVRGNVLLLATIVLLSASVFAQQQTDANAGDPPKVGLRVIEVLAGSPAEAAGLQPMDLIAKYGDVPVVDAASYFVARDAHQGSARMELVYWRGRQRLTAVITAGRMGIMFNEYNRTSYELDSLIQKLDVLIETPDFSEGQIARGALPSRDKLLEQIDAAIRKAALDGSLTPAQILVAKINATPDDSSPAEIETQSALLKELVSSQPVGFIDYLGYEVFFHHKRYRAAVACFRRSLEARPGDANVRLNLGIAYSHLQMFTEADASADYALQHYGINQHGYVVAFQVKASAALGQREFAKALNYANQAFGLNPTSSYEMCLVLLAASQTGDLAKFYEIASEAEKALPAEYARLRPHIDALDAYVLSKNGETEKARAIVSKFTSTPDPAASAKYWRQHPTGDDIVTAWRQLMAQN